MLEVGSAARVMVDYHQGNNPALMGLADKFAGIAQITPNELKSVLARHLSRAIQSALIADFLLEETVRLEHGGPTMADIVIPKSGEGFGATDASRGALLHYVSIEDHKIAK